MLPTVIQKGKQEKHEFLYWEFPDYGGQQAVRMGPWKGVRQNMRNADKSKPVPVELYNLKDDIGESKDLAAKHPEIVIRMQKIMEDAHVPSKLFPLSPIDQRKN